MELLNYSLSTPESQASFLGTHPTKKEKTCHVVLHVGTWMTHPASGPISTEARRPSTSLRSYWDQFPWHLHFSALSASLSPLPRSSIQVQKMKHTVQSYSGHLVCRLQSPHKKGRWGRNEHLSRARWYEPRHWASLMSSSLWGDCDGLAPFQPHLTNEETKALLIHREPSFILYHKEKPYRTCITYYNCCQRLFT